MINYSATDKDLRAIEKGIDYAWSPKLDFIFKKKELIENVIILSYDHKFFYLWKHKNFRVPSLKISKTKTNSLLYDLFKFPHKLKITGDYQLGWWSGFALEKLIAVNTAMSSFADGFNNPWVISGSLVTPFIFSQRLKVKSEKNLNPYTTYESYLATIVHEFGHTYFNKHLTWWFSDKRNNLGYLRRAQNLYAGKKTVDPHQTIHIPNYDKRQTLLTEIFAFCTDYSAASIFWKRHQKDIDEANGVEIKRLIDEESIKDLFQQDSVLDPNPFAHNAAMVIGKLLVTLYPKTWPEKIIRSNKLSV